MFQAQNTSQAISRNSDCKIEIMTQQMLTDFARITS